MGSADRIIRLTIATIIGILFFINVITGTLALVLLVLAGIFVVTSLIDTCPLYLPFGLRTTCARKKSEG